MKRLVANWILISFLQVRIDAKGKLYLSLPISTITSSAVTSFTIRWDRSKIVKKRFIWEELIYDCLPCVTRSTVFTGAANVAWRTPALFHVLSHGAITVLVCCINASTVDGGHVIGIRVRRLNQNRLNISQGKKEEFPSNWCAIGSVKQKIILNFHSAKLLCYEYTYKFSFYYRYTFKN